MAHKIDHPFLGRAIELWQEDQKSIKEGKLFIKPIKAENNILGLNDKETTILIYEYLLEKGQLK